MQIETPMPAGWVKGDEAMRDPTIKRFSEGRGAEYRAMVDHGLIPSIHPVDDDQWIHLPTARLLVAMQEVGPLQA